MADVLIRKKGLAGRITLNRPEALNALSYEMVSEIEKALIAWRDDASIRCVIIDGAGDKAFRAIIRSRKNSSPKNTASMR